MRIKKTQLNEYIRTSEGVWVRNNCISNAPKKDINTLSKQDANTFLHNEIVNLKRVRNELTDFKWGNIVIVSDGLHFAEKQKLLAELPHQSVKVIAVNKALAKWEMLGSNPIKRVINFYVTNNPYEEAIASLPTKHQYYPPCLASLRTNPKFVDKYKGEIFFYSPVYDSFYSNQNDIECKLDDYRNPICAAISFAWHVGVKKLILLCCDDSFEEQRPGSMRLENGCWTYPQQIMSQNIIDAQLHWLKMNNVEIRHHGSGINYKNGEYIPAEEMARFMASNNG